MARPNEHHNRPLAMRTVSERVKIPASAQNDNALNGAARKNSRPVAAATLPKVNNDASSSTQSHGVGGSDTPPPMPHTHCVLAASASWPKVAPVGANWSEYSEPPENRERNTGQYITTTDAKATAAMTSAAIQRFIARTRRWERTSGLSSVVLRWPSNARTRSFHWVSWACVAVIMFSCACGTFDCLDTNARAFVPAAAETSACHGMHNSHHASYGCFLTSRIRVLKNAANRESTQTTGQRNRAISV